MGSRRKGTCRMLYAALLDRLVARGYRVATAGMTLQNPASEGLHRAMGFAPSVPGSASAGSTTRGTT